MTNAEQPADVPEPEAHLDVEEERKRLEEMNEEGAKVRRKVEGDLDSGAEGRAFIDGMAESVEPDEDVEHPLPDR